MKSSPDNCKISFIIPVLNGEEYIFHCIENVRGEMSDGDEIIVVDNGSTDATRRIVREFGNIRLLKYPDLSVSALRNRGAQIASGDLLAFIDCDCLVCPGWRRSAIEVLLNDAMVAATGSHYDLPKNPTWVERAWLSSRRLIASEADYIVGGNFVIRKLVFDSINGFDEAMITDEDTDIGRRLRTRGFKLINAPQVRVIHLGNAKTLKQFICKEYWHATSIVKRMSWQDMDRPMFMTFAFLFLFVAAVATTPMAILGKVNPLLTAALIIFVPFVTALYRIYQFGNFRYLLSQIMLYIIFYFIRSIIVMKFIFISRRFSLRKSQKD